MTIADLQSLLSMGSTPLLLFLLWVMFGHRDRLLKIEAILQERLPPRGKK